MPSIGLLAMASTYTQLYIQIIFVVKFREGLLLKPWRQEVFKYISCIIADRGNKPFIVNGVEDHVHVFLSLNPSQSISDLARDIKSHSSKFINEKNFTNRLFRWQRGFAAFSYTKSAAKNVCNYIERQEEHHRKQSFKDEYHQFLEEHEVEYDERDLFDWLE